MKVKFFNNKGFTLLEILVVVLIIGILAAIALPKYQKAVKKSRAVEAVMNLKSLFKAQEMFRLTNGTYTNNLNNLDIKLNSKYYTYSCTVGNTGRGICQAIPKYTDQYKFDMSSDMPLLCIGIQEACSFISTTKYGNYSEYWIVDL